MTVIFWVRWRTGPFSKFHLMSHSGSPQLFHNSLIIIKKIPLRGEKEEREKILKKYDFLGEKWEHYIEKLSPEEPEQSRHLCSNTIQRFPRVGLTPHLKGSAHTALLWTSFPCSLCPSCLLFLGSRFEMTDATTMSSLLGHSGDPHFPN